MKHHSSFSTWGLPILVILFFIFLYLPVAILALFSCNNNPMSYAWSGFTLRWYYLLFKSPEIWLALSNSLIIALCTTVLTITMSTLVVYCGALTILERFLPSFYLNLAVPEIVLAVGLLSFFYFFSLDFGFISLIVSHTLLGLGYAVPIIYVRFKTLDKRLIEASLDLGATQFQTFFFIALPFLLPALMTAGLLVFVISFDDFILSFFCAGASLQTLPIYIFSLIRAGGSPLVNALSTLLLSISIIIALGVIAIQTRKGWDR